MSGNNSNNQPFMRHSFQTVFHGTVTSITEKESSNNNIYRVANIKVGYATKREDGSQGVTERRSKYVQAMVSMPRELDNGQIAFDLARALNMGNRVSIAMEDFNMSVLDSERDGVKEQTLFIYPTDKNGKSIFYTISTNPIFGQGLTVMMNPDGYTEPIKYTEYGQSSGANTNSTFDDYSTDDVDDVPF